MQINNCDVFGKLSDRTRSFEERLKNSSYLFAYVNTYQMLASVLSKRSCCLLRIHGRDRQVKRPSPWDSQGVVGRGKLPVRE